jgi:hypothetical protein
MRVVNAGVKKRIGVSANVLAIKYGPTLYILFDYSLKNTGLSPWKTKMALNMFPINMLMLIKNTAPIICCPAKKS